MTHRMACCCGDGGGGPSLPCNEPFPSGGCFEIEVVAPGMPTCGNRLAISFPDTLGDFPANLYPGSCSTTQFWATIEPLLPAKIYIPNDFGKIAEDAWAAVYTVDRSRSDSGCPSLDSFMDRGDIEGVFTFGCTADGQWGIISIVLYARLTHVPPTSPTNPQTFDIILFRWNAPGEVAAAFGALLPNQNACESDGQLLGGSIRVRYIEVCGENSTVRIARRCDDPDESIPVDIAGSGGSVFLDYGDHRYYITPETTDDEPVAVSWTDDPCPDEPIKGPFDAVRCRATGPALIAPQHVTYFPTPGVPAGTGTVQLLLETRTPGGACQDIVCVYVIRYRPTLAPAIPGTLVGSHTATATCSLPDQVGCYEDGCAPGIEGRPVNICDQPTPPSWCNEAEGGGEGEAMAMRVGGVEGGMGGVGYSEEFVARQAAHLSTPLQRQARAANCRGCGDSGTEGHA